MRDATRTAGGLAVLATFVLAADTRGGLPCDIAHVQTITAPDGAEGDRFGSRLACGANRLVVGVPNDDEVGTDSGSVYVYRYDGSSYVFEQKIVPDDAAAFDTFGSAVGISRDGITIAIGSRQDDDAGFGSGSVYIYTRAGTVWSFETKLIAADVEANDQFGVALELEGGVLAVGAWRDDDMGTNAGAAYVFRHVDGAWHEEAKLTAPDGGASDAFGVSLAVAGEVVAVGAPNWDDHSSNDGKVYVYRSGAAPGVWTLLDAVTDGDDESVAAGFGGALDLRDGDTPHLIIGADGADASVLTDVGAWYLAEIGAEGVALGPPQYAPDSFPGDGVGTSVALPRTPLSHGVLGNPETAVSGAPAGPQGGYAFVLFYANLLALAGERFIAPSETAESFGAEVLVTLVGPDTYRIMESAPDTGSGTGFGPSANVGAVFVTQMACPDACPADLDGSGAVDFNDLLQVLSSWGPCDGCPQDLDASGAVDFADLLAVLSGWGPCPS